MVGVLVFARRLAASAASPRTRPCCSSARAFQGLGAAMASPAALALITTTFPAGKERNRAFAVYAAMAGVGAAVGLILGGWLTGLDPILGHRGLALHVPDRRADRPGRPRSSPRASSTSPSATPGGSTSPARSPARSACSAIVFGLSRAGTQDYGWDATSDRGQPGPRCRAARASSCWSSRGSSTRCCRSGSSEQPHPRGRLRGDDDRPGGDVRDVLLPQPVHPARRGLLARSRPASRSCRSRSR